MKTGQNNNGYVANAADYSPPSQSTLLLRNGSSNTSSDTTYYPNGQVPSVNSTLTRNSRSTTVDSRQDIGLPNVHGSFNSLQNSILSKCASSAATYNTSSVSHFHCFFFHTQTRSKCLFVLFSPFPPFALCQKVNSHYCKMV